MYETPLPKVVAASTTWAAVAVVVDDGEGGSKRVDVVPVDLVHVPAEGAPPLAERIEVEHVPCMAESLLSVDVDDGDEIRQPVMGGEHHRLPDRALVALGVAEQHVAPGGRIPAAEPPSAAPAPIESP